MWGPLLFAAGVTAAGLHLWRLVWRYLKLRQAMRSWPRVPGQVLGYRTQASSSSRRIDVQVSYQYQGQDFKVWCQSPTRSAFGRADSQANRQVAARFPRHSSQQVFVNPATPGEAFLVLPEPHILAMLAGGGVILVSLAFAIVSPQFFGVDQEVVTLSFMLMLGVVLSVIAVWWDLSMEAFDLFTPDVRVVLQCIALCFVTSLVLGALPALRFSRPALLSTLRSGASGGSRRVGRLQRLTAAAQAGLAIPFLVIGGIKLDQARETATAELGFEARGLYAVRLNPTSIAEKEEGRSSFVRTVREHLSQAAGVTSVSVADGVPLDADDRPVRVAREGEATFTTVHTTRVDADYLTTLGVRLLAGRSVDAGDGPMPNGS